MRLHYTFVFLLLTSMVFGQKSTLFQNVNVRAKELKHNLNDAGDLLIFKCDRTIYEIVIFNDDFERTFKIKDSETEISIADLPVGRYIIEALLSDKLIVITLLRNEPFESLQSAPLNSDNTSLFGAKVDSKKVIAPGDEAAKETSKKEESVKVTEATEKPILPKTESFGKESHTKKTDLALSGKKATPTTKDAKAEKKSSTEHNLSLFSTKSDDSKKATPELIPSEVGAAKANRVVSTYWIIYKINNGQSSERIQKMGDQETVDRMIKKIEIDMKTKSGRLNELTVWTVYDPSQFVRHRRVNRMNYIDVDSESFDANPYYKTVSPADNI